MSFRRLLERLLGVRRPPQPSGLFLAFEGPEEALVYACEYMVCTPRIGEALLCVVDEIECFGDFAYAAKIRMSARGGPISCRANVPDIGAVAAESALHQLCAVRIDSEIGPPFHQRAMELIAILEPTLSERGFKIRKPLSP